MVFGEQQIINATEKLEYTYKQRVELAKAFYSAIMEGDIIHCEKTNNGYLLLTVREVDD